MSLRISFFQNGAFARGTLCLRIFSLLYAEGFSAMLYNAERLNKIQGVKISQNSPSINHPLFVNDSLLLLKVDEGNALEVEHILPVFESCSGQVINKEKSSIMFCKNTGRGARQNMINILHLQSEAVNGKYLGLPVYIGRSKVKAFGYLKEKIW